MPLIPAQRTLLERIQQNGLRRRTDGSRGVRFWVPDDGPAANGAVVPRPADARYIGLHRLGVVDEFKISYEGREALALDAQ